MTRPDELDPVPPVCRPTVDRLQGVLDGELGADSLDADPHPAVCAACRERVAAARVLLSVLATPEPIPATTGLTDRILAAVQADRRTRNRRRVFTYAGMAAAAAVALVVWLQWPAGPQTSGPITPPDTAGVRPTPTPEIGPEPRPAPEPRRINIGDELSKAGLALRGTPKPITEPAAAAPQLFTKLTDALTSPAAAPMMGDMGPARNALADLPAATLSGLEPVTGTAQKAFSRLMRDIGAAGVKPKS